MPTMAFCSEGAEPAADIVGCGRFLPAAASGAFGSQGRTAAAAGTFGSLGRTAAAAGTFGSLGRTAAAAGAFRSL
ncbi:MAG: hypothetical protein V8S96_03690 [Lachnospiraceae bacterium]